MLMIAEETFMSWERTFCISSITASLVKTSVIWPRRRTIC